MPDTKAQILLITIRFQLSEVWGLLPILKINLAALLHIQTFR